MADRISAMSQFWIGRIQEEQGLLDEAESAFRDAMVKFQAVNDGVMEMKTGFNLYRIQGKHDEAKQFFSQAMGACDVMWSKSNKAKAARALPEG